MNKLINNFVNYFSPSKMADTESSDDSVNVGKPRMDFNKKKKTVQRRYKKNKSPDPDSDSDDVPEPTPPSDNNEEDENVTAPWDESSDDDFNLTDEIKKVDMIPYTTDELVNKFLTILHEKNVSVDLVMNYIVDEAKKNAYDHEDFTYKDKGSSSSR